MIYAERTSGYFGKLCNESCPPGRLGYRCGDRCSPECTFKYCNPISGCLGLSNTLKNVSTLTTISESVILYFNQLSISEIQINLKFRRLNLMFSSAVLLTLVFNKVTK